MPGIESGMAMAFLGGFPASKNELTQRSKFGGSSEAISSVWRLHNGEDFLFNRKIDPATFLFTDSSLGSTKSSGIAAWSHQ